MTNRKNYKNNSIKKKINSSFSKFKFKSINISFSKQMVILGSIIGYISLFLPWIIDIENGKIWNSFYSLTGNIGFLLIIIFTLTIFVSISTSYKEKLKLYSDFSLKNHFIIIIGGIFIVTLSIVSLSFIIGLHTFFENLIYGKGVILCMTSGILIFISGLFVRKEYYSDSSEIILDKLSQDRENIKKEGNMKLPF